MIFSLRQQISIVSQATPFTMKRDLVVLQLKSCLQKNNNKGLLCCTSKILIHDNLKNLTHLVLAKLCYGDNLIITAWKNPSPFFTWCGWKDYITTSITTLANKCPDFEIRNCLGCNSNMLYRMVLQPCIIYFHFDCPCSQLYIFRVE